MYALPVLILFIGLLLEGLNTALSAPQNENVLADALAAVSTDRMLADIRTLSGPEFRGRQAGTEDDLRSATWVAEQFRTSGLSPAAIIDRVTGKGISHLGAAGLMTSVLSAPRIDPDPVLRIGPADGLHATQLGAEYLPILDAPSVDVQAPIVFVGYGNAEDYAGIDAGNAVVLFLRGKPDHATASLSHADKVRLARAHGALAYLTAAGPVLNAYELRRGLTGIPSAFYAQMPMADALPGAWISTPLAAAILAGRDGAQSGRLRELQEHLNSTSTARSVRTDAYALLRWKTTAQDGLLTNALALIPGTGPDTIVVGAHRDHLGRTAGLLFPGADDNASGTAVVLEVSRVLAKSGWRPARTIVFVSFSGEEKDLLGSRLYVSRPPAPLTSTAAMINIDHAGIGNGRLTVGITGLDKQPAQEAGRASGLADKLDLFGFFPGGDHVPFKEAGVPTVTIVSGGVHPHFHQPTDSADTMDPAILRSAAQFALALIWQLAN